MTDTEFDDINESDDLDDDLSQYNVDDLDDEEEDFGDEEDDDPTNYAEFDTGPTIEPPEGVLDPADLAQYIAALLDDKKATNIMVLDIRKVSIIADYFVIATGNSERQVKALGREIDTQLSKRDIRPYHQEGVLQGRWILLDYSEVIVHLFTPSEREFYRLERLWSNAQTVVVYQ